MSDQNSLTCSHLKKSFGEQCVLDDISLVFSPGHIYGFQGRNGAGKTVFFKCLLGMMKPDQGTVCYRQRQIGKDVEFLPDTGFLIEHPGAIESLSGFSNLSILYRINHKSDPDRIRQYLKLVGLDPQNKKAVSHYSMGMKQRLGLAQALMENPRILILDEPMNGLDDDGVKTVRNILLSERSKGKIILVASHYAEDLQFLCDHIFRVENGKFICPARGDGSGK